MGVRVWGGAFVYHCMCVIAEYVPGCVALNYIISLVVVLSRKYNLHSKELLFGCFVNYL